MDFTFDQNFRTALDCPETRVISDDRGIVRPLTISRLHWLGYDYLIDFGYATHGRIVEHATAYRPPKFDLTFEQKMAYSIAGGVRAFHGRLGTWSSYIRGA